MTLGAVIRRIEGLDTAPGDSSPCLVYQSKYPFVPVVTTITQIFVPLTLTRSIETTQSPFVEHVVASMVVPLWETCVIV